MTINYTIDLKLFFFPFKKLSENNENHESLKLFDVRHNVRIGKKFGNKSFHSK